ncbi:MAG: hypothetical protein AABX77_00375 [Nanoarchaeota archaeon]
MQKEHSIEELKEKYEKFKTKYNLPEFTELNKLFDVEEISPETEFLLKKIRRITTERITEYLRFIDIILNPSNAPIFFFRLVKKLNINDRNSLMGIYEKLEKFELQAIALDIEYSEKKEAETIKEIFKVFDNSVKKDFLATIEKLNGEEENSKKINGSYFG